MKLEKLDMLDSFEQLKLRQVMDAISVEEVMLLEEEDIIETLENEIKILQRILKKVAE